MLESIRNWFRKKAKQREVLWGYCEGANDLRDQINKAIKKTWVLEVKNWTCEYVGPEGQSGTEKIAEGIDLDELMSAYEDEDYSVRFLCKINYYTFGELGKIIYEPNNSVKFRLGYWWGDKGESNRFRKELDLSKSKLEEAIAIF